MIKVYPRFVGRLGNNLFQVAAAIGYAKKHNVQWGIKKGYIERGFDAFQVDKFFPNLPACDFHFPRYQEHKNNAHCPIHNCGLDVCWFNYHEIPYHPNGVELAGFFQSWKYFDNVKEEVKAAFPLLSREPLRGHISTHFRRGDYLQHPESFPTITGDYIKLAIKKLEELGVEVYHVHVFSDDIVWCKENVHTFIHGTNSAAHFYYHEGNELEDMSDMAACQYNIISNSTISWWSAYLNNHPDKIVVSPSGKRGNWFGFNSGIKTDCIDIIPPDWHSIIFR